VSRRASRARGLIIIAGVLGETSRKPCFFARSDDHARPVGLREDVLVRAGAVEGDHDRQRAARARRAEESHGMALPPHREPPPEMPDAIAVRIPALLERADLVLESAGVGDRVGQEDHGAARVEVLAKQAQPIACRGRGVEQRGIVELELLEARRQGRADLADRASRDEQAGQGDRRTSRVNDLHVVGSPAPAFLRRRDGEPEVHRSRGRLEGKNGDRSTGRDEAQDERDRPLGRGALVHGDDADADRLDVGGREARFEADAHRLEESAPFRALVFRAQRGGQGVEVAADLREAPAEEREGRTVESPVHLGEAIPRGRVVAVGLLETQVADRQVRPGGLLRTRGAGGGRGEDQKDQKNGAGHPARPRTAWRNVPGTVFRHLTPASGSSRVLRRRRGPGR
jgi:hypothetical protein